jgi:hypothetical protein
VSGPKPKSFEISKWAVWEAYRRVKANKGAADVDEQSQRGDAGGAHLDQHVTVADLGLGYVGGAESVLAVLLDDECLDDRSSSQRNSRARLTKSSWNWNTPPCPASG